jgi:hypothetical protein
VAPAAPRPAPAPAAPAPAAPAPAAPAPKPAGLRTLSAEESQTAARRGKTPLGMRGGGLAQKGLGPAMRGSVNSAKPTSSSRPQSMKPSSGSRGMGAATRGFGRGKMV